TSSSGKAWLMPSLADELFAPGQPLDAARYFIVLPDGIGRGGSSKPSDGLQGKFPHYRYEGTLASGYRLITQGPRIKEPRLVLGRHAHVDVGLHLSGPDGRPHPDRKPADPDQRAQLDAAPHRRRGDPPGSGLEQRLLRQEPDAVDRDGALRLPADRECIAA